MFALVDEDFGTGATGTGIAHLPEVVRSRDANDLVVGEASDLLPEGRSLFILRVDRDQQAVFREVEAFRNQLPG